MPRLSYGVLQTPTHLTILVSSKPVPGLSLNSIDFTKESPRRQNRRPLFFLRSKTQQSPNAKGLEMWALVTSCIMNDKIYSDCILAPCLHKVSLASGVVVFEYKIIFYLSSYFSYLDSLAVEYSSSFCCQIFLSFSHLFNSCLIAEFFGRNGRSGDKLFRLSCVYIFISLIKYLVFNISSERWLKNKNYLVI